MVIDREINIKLEPREDGGLRISSSDLPGLILSGPVQGAVLSSLTPALVALLTYEPAES